MKLRWKILRDTPVYGGLFTSDLVLDEPGRPDACRQWFDVLFLGLDGRNIWNATITTGNLCFWERIQDLASEQTRSRLSEAELEEEYRWKFSPPFYVGRQKFYRVIRSEPCRHAALDGLTVRMRKKPPRRFCTIPRLRSMKPFGWTARINTVSGWKSSSNSPVIDRSVIERAILRFRELGEVDWQNPDPIPRAHLPFQTEAEAMAAPARHMPQG
ncbi:hypothetical protein [Paracoccus sp. (in: a-proteobacteria)]|uniref:hypothetical protein n=1 Tax=Paracoccus sp. TaxID=267 RepID=UPI002AFE4D81|nr:hypothetical protein [Paracoccus sp. (in: a-proteobacteria)]